MVDRHWLGDLALAVLLAIPTAALATAPSAVPDVGARVMSVTAEHSPVDGRFSLFAPN